MNAETEWIPQQEEVGQDRWVSQSFHHGNGRL